MQNTQSNKKKRKFLSLQNLVGFLLLLTFGLILLMINMKNKLEDYRAEQKSTPVSDSINYDSQISELESKVDELNLLTNDLTDTVSDVSYEVDSIDTVTTSEVESMVSSFIVLAIVESDPLFKTSASYTISDTDITDWNTAYTWGDHSGMGYLTSSLASASYLRLDGSNDPITGDISMNANLVFDGTRRIIGGTGITSDLYFQSTSGVGATGADIHFLVGNNGATEALTILNNGNVGVGTNNPGSALQVVGNTQLADGYSIGDTVTVEFYGAVGDGVTDDYVAIQAALDAVGAAGGGTVKLTAGKTYMVGSTLEMTYDNVTLSGYGATIKEIDSTHLDEVLFVYGTSGDLIENVTLYGIIVDENYANQVVTNPRAIHVEYAKFFLADSVTVKNAWVSLDLTTGTIQSVVRNSYAIDYYNDGFEVSGSPAYTLEEEPNDIYFINCHTRNPQTGADHAWEIEDGAYNVTLQGCSSPDGIIGIKNHTGGTVSETHDISIIGSSYQELSLSTVTDNDVCYIKDINVISSNGKISDSGNIHGLNVVTADEASFASRGFLYSSSTGLDRITLGNDVNSYIQGSGNDIISFFSSGKTAMSIVNGRVGIGSTTSPNAELEITASTTGLIIKPKTSYTPSDIEGMDLWFKADAIIGLSDGDSVESWVDSASGYNFAQENTDSQPTYQTGEVNGEPVVRFDGTDDYLYTRETISNATEGSVFVVYKMSTYVALLGRTILSSGRQSGVDMWYFSSQQSVTNNDNKMYVYGEIANDGGNAVFTTDEVTLTDYVIGNVTSDGSTWKIYKDGVEQALSIRVGANTGAWWGDVANRTGFGLGAAYDGDAFNYFIGDIAEVIVYDRDLSDTERQGVESYLSTKYNIGSLSTPTVTPNLTEWQDGSGNALLFIDSNGYITGGTETTSDLFLKTTTATGVAGADMHFLVGDNGGTEAMTIFNDGTVGIGSTTADVALDVAGDIESNLITNSDGSGNVCYTAGGANGGVYLLTRCVSSSQRYKENIEDNILGLDAVEALRSVTFDYQDWYSSDPRDIGFIAEEVAEVSPMLVRYNADGQIENVKYEKISAILVKAVQEQQEQITALQLGGQIADGSLTVDSLQVNNEAIFNGIIQANSDLQVKGLVSIGSDGVGQAIIPAGQDYVNINFTKSYAQAPIVTITPASENYLSRDVKYAVINRQPGSFTIKFNSAQDEDIIFDWHAFANL